MASRKQIAANRRNSALSTGPITPAGKLVASANATQHGLTAVRALIPGEDPNAYETCVQGVLADYSPANELERQMCHRVATCLWRLRRAQLIEDQLLAEVMRRSESMGTDASPGGVTTVRVVWVRPGRDVGSGHVGDDDPSDPALAVPAAGIAGPGRLPTPVHSPFPLGVGLLQEETARGMALLRRYEAAAERSLYDAIHELERLQKVRAIRTLTGRFKVSEPSSSVPALESSDGDQTTKMILAQELVRRIENSGLGRP